MKLNRSTVILPLAGLLIVAGAGAAMATSGPAPAATDTTVIPAAESPSAAPATGTTTRPKDTALTTVLDDLVAKGTITEAQEQAILDGVTAERAARKTERQANREQVRTFLADGVITQEEFDQLPADSPLRQMTTLMEDGTITTDELRTLGRGFGLGRGGHGPGWKMAPDGTTPDASPSTSS